MNEPKNDRAWKDLFEEHDILATILKTGCYEITSKKINKVREARLMTKFDHESQLPQRFKANKLSILPIKRGTYVISDFKVFHKFEPREGAIKKIPIKKIAFPSYLESIDAKQIINESIALNCAYISGIIQDFLQEAELVPTISGRMGSSRFEFTIERSHPQKPLSRLEVNGAQIEIDGGYESPKSLSLLEAKNSISDDFLIRQLYYPYRLWKSKVAKPVRTLFMTYSNGIFHFREYEFKDSEHYNSLKLIQEKQYIFREEPINDEIISNILQKVTIKKEPEIPFPQADSFERVINLGEQLYENTVLSNEDITNTYDFDKRQTGYYTNAGRYLGILNRQKQESETGHPETTYSLTSEGLKLFNLSMTQRQVKLIELILSHSIFNQILTLYVKKGVLPSREAVTQLMQKAKLYNIETEKTFNRRSSTVLSWINWILEQRGE